jgi:hypothetical protein
VETGFRRENRDFAMEAREIASLDHDVRCGEKRCFSWAKCGFPPFADAGWMNAGRRAKFFNRSVSRGPPENFWANFGAI